MPGPKSWKGDKRRAKRPITQEQKLSAEQNVGRLQRVVMKRPEPAEGRRIKPAIEKAQKKHRPTGAPLAPAEKRLRTLNKVLRDIEELQRREAAGEELDEAQLTKMERMDDVLEEMEELMAEGSANS